MRSRIPTILAVIILVIGVGFGVFLVQQQQVFRLGASPEDTPQDVRITNVFGSSYTVSWVTDAETVGYLEWGVSEDNLSSVARSEETDGANTHLVTVRNIDPDATYFFKINSNGAQYDNSGSSWIVATGPRLTQPTSSSIISGTIREASGQPAGNVLVYLTSQGAAGLSTITSSTGGWIIPLSEIRDGSLNSYATLNDNDVLELFIQGGASGVATAQLLASTNEVPDITLGQTHDFRSVTSGTGGLPKSNIQLPGNTKPDSGFDLGGSTGEKEDVTLDSVKNNETIFTSEPEFFGEAPVGTVLTITIQSDPITEKITVPSSGEWDWTPPEGLEDGDHTITISWTDLDGLLRTITRSFTVSAAENEPSFESTPSASTATSTPSATPTSTPSATPTPTPRVSLPSTESGIPVAGSLTPTLLLATMGVGLLVVGIGVSRKEY